MSQPTVHVLKYVGSVSCVKGKQYAGSDFTLGSVMQMKTKGVKVSLSGMDAFTITYDDLGYVDTSTTYTFSTDCIIAFGDMVEVT